jgi:hypothetical protein
VTRAAEPPLFVQKSDALFNIGHGNDKKQTYKDGNRLRGDGQWAAVRTSLAG